ncbi:MAG: hypothetical protein ACM3TN_23190 [Alphaproteobacteria bacterium]
MTSKLGAIVAILTSFVGAELLSAAEIVTPPSFKNVVSGKRTMLGRFYDLNPDCSSAGKVILRFMQKPRNGVAEIISEQGFTGYPKDDPRYKCNETSREVEKIFYQSNDEFKGKDQFIVEVFYPNGNYRKLRVNIDVRSAE